MSQRSGPLRLYNTRADLSTGTGINGWIRVDLPLGTTQKRFCWVEYPLLKIRADLEDYNVIFAYF